MSQYFFKVPFAENGDTTTVPRDAQPGGEVSYEEGFGPDYQLPSDDPDVLYPERPVINELLGAVTGALKILQVHGFPDYVTAIDNGGTPYAYDIWSFVRYNGAVYYSLENGNISLPTNTEKWAQFAPFTVPTGVIWELNASSLPAGWVWCNGNTIGSAASGATGRANADTQALFTQIWTDFPNSVRPIQDSSGAPSTRGVSAAADFAANKRLPVADRRGIIAVGRDNMGGASAANRITSGGCGIDGTILGASGGSQNITLEISQIPSHNHGGSTGGTQLTTADIPQHFHYTAVNDTFSSANDTSNVSTSVSLGKRFSGISDPATLFSYSLIGSAVTPSVSPTSPPQGSTPGAAHTHTISSQGGGSAHVNVQPSEITNFIIKL